MIATYCHPGVAGVSLYLELGVEADAADVLVMLVLPESILSSTVDAAPWPTS